MEHIRVEIKGRFTKYAELKAELGYCFYERNASEDELRYIDRLFTPITDEVTLNEMYVVVDGNADALNEELDKQRQQRLEAEYGI